MTATADYDDLDYVITLLETARARLDELNAARTRKSDVFAEYDDKLADLIGEAEKRRDGEPLEAVLAEQARDDRELRDHYQRSVA